MKEVIVYKCAPHKGIDYQIVCTEDSVVLWVIDICLMRNPYIRKDPIKIVFEGSTKL